MPLDMKAFNKIVGKHGNTKNSMMRDTDGDGVMNVLDCKPYNPKEQGLIHKIGAKVARRVGAKDAAQSIEDRGERLDRARIQAREEAAEERGEQMKQTAVFKEQERGRRQRERIKAGGTFGSIGRGIKGFQSFAASTQPKPMVTTTTRKTKKGKGKKGKKSKTKKSKPKARVAKLIQDDVQQGGYDFRNVRRII